MKRLYSVQASDLKQQYKSLGTDISRIIDGVEEFELIEDDDGLRTWSPPVTGDSQFYSELADNNSWYYLPDKKEYDIAFEFIGDKSVLEVGCGEGHFPLRKNISSYIGLELNQEAVKKANAKGLNVKLQDFQEYASQNPSSVSSVCSFQVLEHLPVPGDFFQSAYEVLQNDGLMITAVPSEDSFAGTIKTNCLNAPPHHITRWTDKCLKMLPSKYGFECIDIVHIPVEPIHYNWFWSTLLDRVLNQRNSKTSIKDKIKRKILMKMLVSLGVTNIVPDEFCIPGHTVVAVHKKIAT